MVAKRVERATAPAAARGQGQGEAQTPQQKGTQVVRREGELGAGRHTAERAAAERPSLRKQKALGTRRQAVAVGQLGVAQQWQWQRALASPGRCPDKSKNDGGAGLSSKSSQEAVVSASWAWRTPESAGPAGSRARSLARISPAKVGSWRCSTGSVSAHDAQYAAGASAPCWKGSWAIRNAESGRGPVPNRSTTHAAIAASWDSAKASEATGGNARRTWVHRGEAQNKSSNQADCKSGSVRIPWRS